MKYLIQITETASRVLSCEIEADSRKDAIAQLLEMTEHGSSVIYPYVATATTWGHQFEPVEKEEHIDIA